MISEALVKKGLYDAMRAILPNVVMVIWADQNQERPARPYLTMKLIMGPQRRGNDEQRYGNDGSINHTGVREFDLSINLYGPKAQEYLSMIQSYLNFESIKSILLEKDLVFVRDSGVRDLSLLLENRTETRAQLDLHFRTSANVIESEEEVGSIETVELENEMDGTITVINPPD